MIKIKQNIINFMKPVIALCLTLSFFGCDVYNWKEGAKTKNAEEITSFNTWVPILSDQEKWYYVTGSYPDEFQWSDTSEGGFGSPTGDISVSIYQEDGYKDKTDVDNGYSSPIDFDNYYNDSDEKIYIVITAKSVGMAYIRVNAGSSW